MVELKPAVHIFKIQKIKNISKMKKLLSFFIFSVLLHTAFAQDETDSSYAPPPRTVENRPKDHLQFQLGSLFWQQSPDSVTTKGLSRSFNFYFCFDIPFKTDPRFSIGVGAGIGSDHMFFDKNSKREIDITSDNGIRFRQLTGADTNNRYKSIKLHTAYLEAPIEFRFMNKPSQYNKSWKFNNLRLAGYARIGYGNIGLFFQYQLNDFIKEGQGPNQIRPFQVGITFSGL